MIILQGFLTSLKVHCVAGGMAGAIAAACSNPLDVIKTRLQTQVTEAFEMTWKSDV